MMKPAMSAEQIESLQPHQLQKIERGRQRGRQEKEEREERERERDKLCMFHRLHCLTQIYKTEKLGHG